MKKIKCLIIEDEPLAAELLAGYISQIDLLELKGIYYKATDALRMLKAEEIDLIFLDLHLPGIKG
ncbi:MAG: response regulator, partial [Bacteroidota bacterium]